MNDQKWWNRSSFKNIFLNVSKEEIYVVQELGLQYWNDTPTFYLTYTTENSVSRSWWFSLIQDFSRKMPKQNPFGKIGEDSPPETPTKKGNEPEPERTLLIKHDVCVYRMPPQDFTLTMLLKSEWEKFRLVWLECQSSFKVNIFYKYNFLVTFFITPIKIWEKKN